METQLHVIYDYAKVFFGDVGGGGGGGRGGPYLHGHFSCLFTCSGETAPHIQHQSVVF